MSNELIIKIEANQTNGMVVSELNLDGSNITIDWGDSTVDDYSEDIEHEYDEEGEYTITITGVSGIGNSLLMNVSNVVEVIIPNNITSLPNQVFRECSNLEKVVLPNGISSIGSRFCHKCANLVEINLPDGLENIGTYFLFECGLNEVIFPYGVSVIDMFTLYDSNVSNVVIPKSVTRIGDYAFQNCQNLSYIEIPNSVESIGTFFGYGSSLTTIKFNSETPPTIGLGLLMSNDNCSFYVPEGSLDAYLNASNYPSDSARYVEYPTLKHKLETLGKLMASNLTEQFVSASWDEGLTTLANKIQDIELNNMTGFLADIGFYDQDSWSGIPPTILKDRIIFNGRAEFPFNNVVFPDTFTWSFILTTHDKIDELTEPILIGQYPSLNLEESVDMEFCIMITRENGGDFIIKCDETADEWSFNSLSSETLIITPYGTKPVTISGIYFSENYYDYNYSTIRNVLSWDRFSIERPLKVIPVYLSKDNRIIKEYDLNYTTQYLPYRNLTDLEEWYCYHYKGINDDSDYSWLNLIDYGYPLETETNYNIITHNMDNGAYRIDHLVPYPINGCESFPASDYTYNSNDKIYTINENMNWNWGLTFEYHEKEETNNERFDISFLVSFPRASWGYILRFYLTGETLSIDYGANGISLSDMEYSPDMIFKIYQQYDEKAEHYLFTIEVNGLAHTIETGDDIGMVGSFQSEKLSTIFYDDENCELTKFYYWNMEL